MKKIMYLVLILAGIMVLSCNKSKPSGTDNNPAKGFNFSALTTNDTLMKVNETATITAFATGSSLTYEWTATFGTFIGSGPTVQWTVCHADNFTITCKVSDNQSNTEDRKSVV